MTPRRSLLCCLAAVLCGVAAAPPILAAEQPPAGEGQKELYLPQGAMKVPEGNDYDDPASDYCRERMVEGENVVIFWHKEYGADPSVEPPANKRFDVKRMLSECERYYRFYVDELKMVERGASLSDDYKLVIWVFGGEGGTAFGGGVDEKIGALWTPAVRVNRFPYGVLAHEMGHSFQYLAGLDSGAHPRGAIHEMSAQYLLWQVYPEWMRFENYHLNDFLKKTHFAFLHPTNMYHSPYVLEYWSGERGVDFFGRLWRSTQQGEDVVQTYQRLTGLTQPEFNDEMFDACRRFITWDLPRVEELARPYANMHQCSLKDAGDGWLRVTPDRCPQDYGYNGIELHAPAAGTRVKLSFRGVAGAEGYTTSRPKQAGWRYGFVAHLSDNRRVYSETHQDPAGEAVFSVPEGTEHLWLVVMGAPTEHRPLAGMRRRGGPPRAEDQWPYEVRFEGTFVLEPFLVKAAAAVGG